MYIYIYTYLTTTVNVRDCDPRFQCRKSPKPNARHACTNSHRARHAKTWDMPPEVLQVRALLVLPVQVNTFLPSLHQRVMRFACQKAAPQFQSKKIKTAGTPKTLSDSIAQDFTIHFTNSSQCTSFSGSVIVFLGALVALLHVFLEASSLVAQLVPMRRLHSHGLDTSMIGVKAARLHDGDFSSCSSNKLQTNCLLVAFVNSKQYVLRKKNKRAF